MAYNYLAPFALLAEEILLMSSNQQETSQFDGVEELLHIEVAWSTSPSKINNAVSLRFQQRDSNASEMDFFEAESESLGVTGDESEVYLGIHNIAITMP